MTASNRYSLGWHSAWLRSLPHPSLDPVHAIRPSRSFSPLPPGFPRHPCLKAAARKVQQPLARSIDNLKATLFTSTCTTEVAQ